MRQIQAAGGAAAHSLPPGAAALADWAGPARRAAPSLIRDFPRTFHGIPLRHRRPAQCRQVDPFQRADAHRRRAGGELSVLHHRAEHRRRGGARSAPRPAGGDRQAGPDRADAHQLRRHRRAGARRLQGRRAGQPVPRQHPRGRRGGARAALLRGHRRHPCGRQDRPGRRRRDGQHRADAGRSRQPRTAGDAAAQAGAVGRQGGAAGSGADGRGPRPARRGQAGAPGRGAEGGGRPLPLVQPA